MGNETEFRTEVHLSIMHTLSLRPWKTYSTPFARLFRQ